MPNEFSRCKRRHNGTGKMAAKKMRGLRPNCQTKWKLILIGLQRRFDNTIQRNRVVRVERNHRISKTIVLRRSQQGVDVSEDRMVDLNIIRTSREIGNRILTETGSEHERVVAGSARQHVGISHRP